MKIGNWKLKIPLSIIADEIGGIALAAVFLWFGIEKFTDSNFWTAQIPDVIANLVPFSLLTFSKLHGAFEIITGLLLIARPWHRIGAAFATANLVAIILTMGLTRATTEYMIRDIGLLGLALDILLTPHKRSLLDRLRRT